MQIDELKERPHNCISSSMHYPTTQAIYMKEFQVPKIEYLKRERILAGLVQGAERKVPLWLQLLLRALMPIDF